MENNIVVYTLPNCIQCNQTKKLLTKLELGFDTVDLTQNEDDYRFVTERLGYKAAPVVVVYDRDGQVLDHWSGFVPEKIGGYDV